MCTKNKIKQQQYNKYVKWKTLNMFFFKWWSVPMLFCCVWKKGKEKANQSTDQLINLNKGWLER